MEALKKESDEMNKAKDAKRKYERYHSAPEEAQKKKADMRKYRYEHQEEINLAKKEYYKQKTKQLKIEENPERKESSQTSDHNNIDKTKRTRTKAERNIDDCKCPICEKEFVLPRVKERHMEHVHSKASHKTACDICDKSFEYKDNLHRHMKEVHSGERHKCEVCPATFTRSFDFQNHKETGDHYLAFYCCICCKELVFKHLGGLINHVVVKQNVEVLPRMDGEEFKGRTIKWLNSGILLTCKSRFECILVEKGKHVSLMKGPLHLEGFKKRMRKKEEIINYGLREAHGSKEKTSVKLEFLPPETTHDQVEGKSHCRYCGISAPFTNENCDWREKKQTRTGTSWTLERRTDN